VPTLAMIYKVSPKGFREYAWKEFELDLTDSQAVSIHRAFYSRWPDINAWHDREGRILRQRLWTKTPLGRMRRLPGAASNNRQVAEESIRQGINAPVQGLAWEITQSAGIALEQVVPPDVGYGVLDVHDQILMYVREECAEEWAPKIGAAMEAVPQYLRPLGLEIPPGLIKVEVQIGPWGAGVDFEKWRDAQHLAEGLDIIAGQVRALAAR
jgi:DNA polymerase I-like protein with 3'-5' exonuclease and polymerase domains